MARKRIHRRPQHQLCNKNGLFTRHRRYVCSARRRKGPAVCPSDLSFNVDGIDSVFLDALEDFVLAPTFIDRVLDAAFASNPDVERAAWQTERDQLAKEIANLTQAIAAVGSDIPALAKALAERDARLKSLDRRFAQPVAMPDRDELKAALELRTAVWRTILRGLTSSRRARSCNT
jgi:hypothetical protein